MRRFSYGVVLAGLMIVAVPTSMMAKGGSSTRTSLAVHVGHATSSSVSARGASTRSVANGRHQLPLLVPPRSARPTVVTGKDQAKRSLGAASDTNADASTNVQASLTSSGWLGMNHTVNDSDFGCATSSLCLEPPDPGVGVGPANVVQTVNLDMRIYDKSGTTLLTVPLMGLFDTYGDYGSSDPQVAYQSATGHWFASLISWDCDNGFLNLAVSDSSDPTGSWSIWRIEYTGALPDFPGLGFTDDKIIIGVNQYAIDSGSCEPTDYIGTSAIAWDISDLLDDNSAYYAYTSPEYDLWDWRPAMSESSTSDVRSIVTDTYTGSFYYVDGQGSVVDLATAGPHPFTEYSYDLSGDFAVGQAIVPPLQPDGSLEIDNRVTSAVWRSGRLVFVSTYPCGNSDLYDCVRISELDSADVTANQDFLVGDSGSHFDNFMGGVAMDANGTLYLVWSRTRSDTPVGIWASYQLNNDGSDTFDNGWLSVRSGAGGYAGGRWGDFAILSTDPSDGGAIWQAHEFVKGDGGWGTYVSKLTVPVADSTPPSVTGATGVIIAPQTLGSTAKVHMSWSASDTSGISRYDFQIKKGTGVWTSVSLPTATSTGTDLTLTVGTFYRFRVRATDGANNTSAWVSTDAAKLRLVQENATAVAYSGTWKRVALSGASGGHVKYAAANTAHATLTFKGAAASFVTTVASARGIMQVWIDGSLAATVDTYSASTSEKRIVYATPRLSYGTHTIQIRVTGTKRSASSATRVDVDAFLTWP